MSFWLIVVIHSNHKGWLSIKLILCVNNKSSRHQDYVKRLTPWAASVCLKTAPSSKTSGPWSECVKYKQHCASRGEDTFLAFSIHLLAYKVNHNNNHYCCCLCFSCRILFLRQQIKELEKLKNQNSFMV